MAGPSRRQETRFQSPKAWMIVGGIVLAACAAYLLLASGSDSTPSEPISAVPKFKFLFEWGEQGSGPGQFDEPRGLAIDRSGNVYVVDSGNDRIQKFTSTGQFLTQWSRPNHEYSTSNAVAVDSSGFVYATYEDENRHGRVQKYTSSGSLIAEWGLSPFSDYPYSYQGIATSGGSDVFVVQNDPERVHKYTAEGQYIKNFGGPYLYLPGQIAVDEGRFVYVSSRINWVVDKFSMDGQFIESWIKDENGEDLFLNPNGLAVDEHGNVFVVNSGLGQIRVLTSDGKKLCDFGRAGSDQGSLGGPFGIAISPKGLVFVSDSARNCILIFASFYFPPDASGRRMSDQGIKRTASYSDKQRQTARGSRIKNP